MCRRCNEREGWGICTEASSAVDFFLQPVATNQSGKITKSH